MDEASFFFPKISQWLITLHQEAGGNQRALMKADWVSSSLEMQLMDHSVGPLLKGPEHFSGSDSDFGPEQTALSEASLADKLSCFKLAALT